MTLHKKKSNQNVRDRIKRALNEKLFLIEKNVVEASEEEKALERAHKCEIEVPKQMFYVLGSTGNIYDVKIYFKPTCTCPDFAKGNLCKHILFVYLKVLKLSTTSDLIYQTSLLSTELVQILTSATDPTVLADKRVRDEFSKLMGTVTKDNDAPKAPQRPIEGDCPICFDPMCATDKVVFCKECGNNVHQVCWDKWSAAKKGMQTCVYCRAPTQLTAKAPSTHQSQAVINEGYLNLSRLQPNISIQRGFEAEGYSTPRRSNRGRTGIDHYDEYNYAARGLIDGNIIDLD